MRRLILCMGFMLLTSQTSNAEIPVHDYFNYVENIFTKIETKLIAFNTKVNNIYAIRKIRNQLIQIQEAKNRFSQLKRQYETLTGKYGYGQWLKGPARLLNRSHYSPESPDELMRLLRQGESTGLYKDDRDAWVNIYLPSDPSRGNIGGVENDRSHQQSALTDVALILELESNYLLYADSKKRLQAMDDIAEKIDKTENVKEAIDLLNINILALHSTTDKLLALQSRMAHRAAVHDTGTMIQNKRQQEFMQW